MKCHYEVLEVPFDVNAEDLKKAYRKAALRWHPDKNPENVEEAKTQFQLVQQAFEVLSDSHERAWYDAHRDAILKGGLGENYKDDSLNVYPYFSSSCYSGYGDDDKGFYTVYREIFNKITAEDLDYMSESDDPLDIPSFGTSTSDFKQVVSRFYQYWQDYSTKKSYSWLDQYDIKDLPNRRIAKLVEKENKKIRDRARKDRNEEIRNLVAFVRKRDKRVQAHSKLVEQQTVEKAKVAAEKKKAKIKERQEALKQCQEAEWAKHTDMEAELKNIERTLCDNQEDEESDALFCIACNKFFRTTKSFANHENSKKHKENVKELKQQMLHEEEEFEGDGSSDAEGSEKNSQLSEGSVREGDDVLDTPTEGDDISKHDSSCDDDLPSGEESDDLEDDIKPEQVNTSKKNKKNKKKVIVIDESDNDETDLMDDLSMMSKRQRKKLQERDLLNGSSKISVKKDSEGNTDQLPSSKSGKKRGKEVPKPKSVADDVESNLSSKNLVSHRNKKELPSVSAPSNVDHCCVICKSDFTSKNKLFEHLKKTGHSVYIPGKGLDKNVKKGKVKQK